MTDDLRHVKPTTFEERYPLPLVIGMRVRRGCDWAWVLETQPDKVRHFGHLLLENGTRCATFSPSQYALVRLPGKPDTLWNKQWIDQVDDKPIKAGDRVHFVPGEAIRAHYNLPISAIATVTHNASGNELSHLMQVRLLDGREGKFCYVQDVKSLIRREDL